jgi:hypothetical protein
MTMRSPTMLALLMLLAWLTARTRAGVCHARFDRAALVADARGALSHLDQGPRGRYERQDL